MGIYEISHYEQRRWVADDLDNNADIADDSDNGEDDENYDEHI